MTGGKGDGGSAAGVGPSSGALVEWKRSRNVGIDSTSAGVVDAWVSGKGSGDESWGRNAGVSSSSVGCAGVTGSEAGPAAVTISAVGAMLASSGFGATQPNNESPYTTLLAEKSSRLDICPNSWMASGEEKRSAGSFHARGRRGSSSPFTDCLAGT